MNLRISENQIRIKLSKPDAKHLLDTGSVSQTLFISDRFSLSYQVLVTENLANDLAADDQSCELILLVKRTALENLIKEPTKSGIVVVKTTSDRTLNLILQVDMEKCN